MKAYVRALVFGIVAVVLLAGCELLFYDPEGVWKVTEVEIGSSVTSLPQVTTKDVDGDGTREDVLKEEYIRISFLTVAYYEIYTLLEDSSDGGMYTKGEVVYTIRSENVSDLDKSMKRITFEDGREASYTFEDENLVLTVEEYLNDVLVEVTYTSEPSSTDELDEALAEATKIN
ncbi:hypothetical protein Spith_0303 [Spirochaeta thermophila DSM 6578]|uniref:Lipoprotein n=1 Tax=Winmispira thermophila (strain ATCC 700085 / DSM 6578 / Z-1203) TaxID=869211 RepID=G0GDG3_WINT7|nr:hypothetical protein [Spirochaeta thermophila]AEJ60589.1 hypothetical protein Spith_0303 [Spirochaeta thermophila DSM 6578]